MTKIGVRRGTSKPVARDKVNPVINNMDSRCSSSFWKHASIWSWATKTLSQIYSSLSCLAHCSMPSCIPSLIMSNTSDGTSAWWSTQWPAQNQFHAKSDMIPKWANLHLNLTSGIPHHKRDRWPLVSSTYSQSFISFHQRIEELWIYFSSSNLLVLLTIYIHRTRVSIFDTSKVRWPIA